MVLGQKHIPDPQLLGLGLQVLHDGRVGLEALDGRLADLAHEDRVGGDAFFLDEFLDL
jgi:hypothetical protein